MTELGKVFGNPGVAAAYVHRPPYPSDVFDILTGLIVDEPRTVLDIGAGEGAIARPLAPRVDRVDALDISAVRFHVREPPHTRRQPSLTAATPLSRIMSMRPGYPEPP